LNASFDGFGGIAARSAAGVTARSGFAGQLQNLDHLTLAASNLRPPERTVTALSALAWFDDATLLPLPATEVRWTVVEGPIDSISAAGLASAGAVYRDTLATVRGTFQDRSTTLGLTVLNSGSDDLGSYAGDGIDDLWQVRFFGLNNPNAVPSADPDGDGADNRSEFIADTDPTDRQSRLQIANVTVGVWGCAIRCGSAIGRRYTLEYRGALVGGSWTTVRTQTDVPGTGGVLVLIDPAPTTSPKFYRVGVRVP
jgi:hypothetical protein